MKIVVIGGNGRIGSKLVVNLRERGHEVLPASPSSGVNIVTGEGLSAAVAGARTVVDVANAPSWEDNAVMDFFEISGRNLLAAEKAAGVKHHVALSVVGTEGLQSRRVLPCEDGAGATDQASSMPYTIVRATQFFEFVEAIAQSGGNGQTIRLPSALMQPIVSDDVAAALATVAIAEPRNDTVELAGPDLIPMDELVRQFLRATKDSRQVIADPKASYFGTPVDNRSLVPAGKNPLIGPTHFADWLSHSRA